MEDAHTIMPSLPNHPNTAFVGVFDGHSGKNCSEYLRATLWRSIDSLPKLTPDAITEAMIEVDKFFLREANPYRTNGSTAVIALITPITEDETSKPPAIKNKGAKQRFHVLCAWVGDSRCWTMRQNSLLNGECVTTDHKPTERSEADRIIRAGGMIAQNRVDGKLAVSRAFGDWAFKSDQERDYVGQRVIAVPEIIEFELEEGDKLLLGCDGLVELMDDNELMEVLQTELNNYKDPVYSLGATCDECLKSGSADNMSAVFVDLSPGNKYGELKPKTYVPGPLYQSIKDKSFIHAFMNDAAKYGFEDGVGLRTAAYKEDIRQLIKESGVNADETLPVDVARKIDEINRAIKDLKSWDFGHKTAVDDLVACNKVPAELPPESQTEPTPPRPRMNEDEMPLSEDEKDAEEIVAEQDDAKDDPLDCSSMNASESTPELSDDSVCRPPVPDVSQIRRSILGKRPQSFHVEVPRPAKQAKFAGSMEVETNTLALKPTTAAEEESQEIVLKKSVIPNLS